MAPSPRLLLATSALCALTLLSCGEAAKDPGALLDLSMKSSAGVLLDEIPAAHRDRVAAALLAEPDAFWRARATMQVETTYYKLTFRNLFDETKGILPLPPRELWELDLSAPERRTIDGHDLVVVDYTFTSTLLSAVDEPEIAEPMLAAVGGIWDEPFVLPIDPEHLLERTGYACMDEEDFPPNSVDTENARTFFDDTCEAGPAGDGCHVSEEVAESCVDALRANIGAIETAVRFERVAWDSARADEVRVGEQVSGGPQLVALQEGVEDNRIVYRYYPEDSCAIAEGCVGGAGWRRLLQFTATMHNQGDEDVVLGDVSPESPLVKNKMVSFSQCHGHMHFNHYGKFTFGDGSQELGSKRAFCLESTTRYSNTELAALTHPYTCQYQGTAAGWGDDYIAGLDCQWIDITPVGGMTAPLTFQLNPDGFLCEGELITDAAGDPTFEVTDSKNEQGENESRFACEERDDWTDGNLASTMVEVPTEGGMVTSACTRGQLGDHRNCGFTKQDDAIACTPGQTTTLTCTATPGGAPQVLRICEQSALLGHAVPCLFREALASATIDDQPVEVSFPCPGPRDAMEPGGNYSTFVAPAIPSDALGSVTCN
ncbi:MAG: lysyl oxidase family protein [Nannocystaceae bacterium]